MQAKELHVWTSDHIVLQRWLALPKKERKPKTALLLAAEMGVDEATLYRWRKQDGFAAEVRKLIRENLHDDLSEIYAALRREAKAGSFQHIKMALELAGEYVEKQEIKTNLTFTAEDAAKAESELNEWMKQNAQKLNG